MTYFATVHLRLGLAEFRRMAPGLFYDLVQIWSNSHKPKENEV